MSAKNLKNRFAFSYITFGKRIFDLSLAIIMTIVLIPIIICICLLILIDDQFPIIYTQKRVGKAGKEFTLYKFRTMVNDASMRGPLITVINDHRVTRVGKLLRRYKLDELPQMINIIKGDMSLVGPRPECKKFVDLFESDYQEVLKVRPGLTDFASLEYINEESMLITSKDAEEAYIKYILPEKIKMYYKYLNEMSMLIDLKIIIMTMYKVVCK